MRLMRLVMKLCGQYSFPSDMKGTECPLCGVARESLFLCRRGLVEDPLISTGRFSCFLGWKSYF